ncbi:MAG: hypothetical protein J6Y85_02630 [Alphaproteobacteria bacterium]|nr:hypothetical protein [Alphaproteobacteria bacterium]
MAIFEHLKNAKKETEMRDSTEDTPISQEDLLAFKEAHPEKVFQVKKIPIPVSLKKVSGQEKAVTTVLARDGRLIEETIQTAQDGFAIDTRTCINGAKDQYAKKPAKAGPNDYTVDDGRTFEDMKPGETAAAHTVGGKVRNAFVAEKDMWIATSWGVPQRIGRGGLITFMGNEAIGNNNPCDLVIQEGDKSGKTPLTTYAYNIAKEYEATFGKKPEGGVKLFLDVALEEDKKNPYQMQIISRGNVLGG